MTKAAELPEETILSRLGEVMERWYAGDPLAYADLFVDDLTYFAPVCQRGRLEGIAALKEILAPFTGKTAAQRFEVLNPKTQLDGDVRVLTYGLNEYADDGSVRARWNATEVYRHVGDEWRIVHAHWSGAPAS